MAMVFMPDETMPKRPVYEKLGIPIPKSDQIFYAHRNDPGFVEGIVKFFNGIDERMRKAATEPTPLFVPEEFKKDYV